MTAVCTGAIRQSRKDGIVERTPTWLHLLGSCSAVQVITSVFEQPQIFDYCCYGHITHKRWGWCSWGR